MRVLQICHSYYPPFLDCARQYSKLFEGTEYKVLTVYLTGEPDAEVERATCSDEVIFLGYKSSQVSGLKLNAIARVRKIVASEDFLFCIAHRAKPTYVALLASNLPVISIHHNYNDFGRFSRRVMVNIFRRRLLLLGVSDSVRDDMRKQLPNWPKERIQTLYNRIDVEATQATQLSKIDARRFLALPDDAWIVGNVGRLHHDKDQATLIRGFHKALINLPVKSLLVIMGSGPLESDLKALVASLGIGDHVVFTGKIAEARKYFKAFDVFALTSDHEPFGMVLLEAMAAGVPLICSDCGGGAEVVRDIGELFPLGSADALATSLIRKSEEDQTNASRLLKKLDEDFSDQSARSKFRKVIENSNILK
ncbi:MAG TPA: glycosyltransferase [Methylotenera sp.]|nr:glycosyltransferase [Methylotenera sp.]